MPFEWRRRRTLIGRMQGARRQGARTQPNSVKKWRRRCRMPTTAQTEYPALNCMRVQRKLVGEIEARVGLWPGTSRRWQRDTLGSSDLEPFAMSRVPPFLGCVLAKYAGRLSNAQPPQRQSP